MDAKQISLALILSAWGTLAQEAPQITFGTTVVSSAGFQGKLFHLKVDTDFLPRLDKMRPVGTIYTNAIRIPAQAFQAGFPGITERFEWFGILYTAKIWVETEGRYGFGLLSDDGSKLKVDNKLLIDNDGIHGPQRLDASAVLTRGVHDLEVAYFQGPRFHLALELSVMPPDEAWKILNTNDFPAPSGTMQLPAGKIQSIKSASNFGNEAAPPRPFRP